MKGGPAWLTAIGVEEPDKAVFVARDDDAFNARPGHGTATTGRTASAAGVLFVETLVGLIQPDCRGYDCVYASGHGAIVRFQARHVSNLLPGACIVDNDSGIGVADNKCLSVDA
jgi:hypothetical protein